MHRDKDEVSSVTISLAIDVW